MPKGKHLNWTDEQIASNSQISDADIERAKVRVKETNPGLAALLDAEPKDLDDGNS